MSHCHLVFTIAQAFFFFKNYHIVYKEIPSKSSVCFFQKHSTVLEPNDVTNFQSIKLIIILDSEQ